MLDILEIVATVWGAWILFNLGAMVVVSITRGDPPVPMFDGFCIRMPKDIRAQLTDAEFNALVEHEEGHRANWHVWKNFAGVCVFSPASAETRMRQEFEADDFVDDQASLASALRKLSFHRFDLLRASRIEARIIAAEPLTTPGGHSK